MGCPIPVMKPRRQRSTPRRPTLGALNLTESRRARPCAICRREPGHAGGSAQHLAPPVAVDAEGEDRRRRKTLASGSFSTRTRRLIISSVIGGSSVALVDSQPDPTDEPPVTTPSCSLTTALRRARFVSGLLPSSYTISRNTAPRNGNAYQNIDSPRALSEFNFATNSSGVGSRLSMSWRKSSLACGSPATLKLCDRHHSQKRTAVRSADTGDGRAEPRYRCVRGGQWTPADLIVPDRWNR